jgi:hypothetical protein
MNSDRKDGDREIGELPQQRAEEDHAILGEIGANS